MPPGREVARVYPVDEEAAAARGDVGEVHGCPVGLAKDDVAFARAVVAARGSVFCPDDKIGQAVAVDVAGIGDAVARLVTCIETVDDKAAGSGGEIR